MMKKIIILGGGVTGLVLAKELSDTHKDNVILIEKESFLGGLAATLPRDNLLFDLGSHRIHSDYSKKIVRYLKEILGVRILKRPRNGLMYFNGKFVKYPPNIFNFIKIFSLNKTFEYAINYLENIFARRKSPRASNYKEAIIKVVGEKIYNTFYKDFAKKLWGIYPENVAVEGMRRRSTFLNFRAIIRNLSGQDNFFFYPLNGIGDISNKLEEKILQNKVTIIKDAVVKNIVLDKGHVSKVVIEEKSGNILEIESELVISTIPIDSLYNLIYDQDQDVPHLRWNGLRILYLHIQDSLEYKNDTFYFPEKSVPFGRISDIGKFSTQIKAAYEGTSLTIEIPSSAEDELWDIPEDKLVRTCVDNLIKTRLLKKEPAVLKYFSVHVEKAYPIYEIGWADKFYYIYNKLLDVKGLFTIGRKGLFLHCNIDHCMIQGLELSAYILQHIPNEQKVVWGTKAEKFMYFSARD